MATQEDYAKLLKRVREETGIDSLVPDDTGLVSVRVEDRFNVNLQFVEATGKVLCFVEVAQLPADTSKDVYRDLLAGGLFGKETAGGYFALEPDTETVVYNYFFDLDRAAEDTSSTSTGPPRIRRTSSTRSRRSSSSATSGPSASRPPAATAAPPPATSPRTSTPFASTPDPPAPVVFNAEAQRRGERVVTFPPPCV